MCNVPPTRIGVIKSQSPLVGKRTLLPPYSVGPMSSVSEPPLLPVKSIVGEKVIMTFLPWQSFISKMAGWAFSPDKNVIPPIDVLLPSQPTVTVPPELVTQNEPKLSACVGVTVIDRGGKPGCANEKLTQKNKTVDDNNNLKNRLFVYISFIRQ